MTPRHARLLVCSSLMVACTRGEPPASASPAPAATAPAGVAEAGEAVPLAKLGLSASAPKGTVAADAIVGDGLTLDGPALLVNVEKAVSTRPQTLEAAKTEAGPYMPTNLVTETLPDGWTLTFESAGGLGTNYWVQARREFAGQAYFCETTAARPEGQRNALSVCKSLRP